MRATVLATAICLSAIGLSSASDTQAAVRQSINIPAQGLGPALQTLAKAHNFQLVYRPEFVRDVRTAGAVGELTSEEALTRLLQGTGLMHRRLDDKTMTIVPLPASSERGRAEASSRSLRGRGTEEREEGKNSEGQENEKSFWSRFRLAQLDQGQASNDRSAETSDTDSERKPARIIEEVFVTAQKREERAFDVPISLVVLGADELQQRALTSLEDLQLAVPGLSIQSAGYSRQIQLRGISNVEGNSAQIGLYLDEAAVTLTGFRQINPSTYDLERVEVLRGPQGTLYGEGSAGGTIRFITKSPVLDRFGMAADVAALFTEDGEPGQRINAMLNVPLIENKLGLRVAGTYDHKGGWIDQPAALQEDINGQNLTNVRVKGLWQPSPQFTASAMAEIYRDNRSMDAAEDAQGNFTQAFNLTTTPKVEDDHDIFNLTLTYDFPSVRILSSTSYIEARIEGKPIGFISLPIAPGAGSFTYYAPSQLGDNDIWSEELRLTSIGSGPWQWTVGGFYRRNRDLIDAPVAYFSVGPPGTPLPPPFGFQIDTLFESWSVFGDISYKLSDRFTLGAGVRYFQDDQDFTQVFDGFSSTQTGRFHSTDPRVYAQYELTDDVNVYASAAKGFRSGGFNAEGQPTFDPEKVWTYELGTKTSLLEGRLRADTALFYTNYTDYIVIGGTPTILAGFVNAGDARLWGIEWDLTWQPADQWALSFNGNYLDTEFTEINATGTAHAVGDPLSFVPKYQFTVSAERDFEWNGKAGFARLDYSQRGRATFMNRNFAGWDVESDVLNLLSYYMSLQWNENLSLNLFAQNLLNDRDLLTPSPTLPSRPRPRTYGIGFNFTL